jgi:hypothetical protein
MAKGERRGTNGERGGNVRRWVFIGLGAALFAAKANRAREIYLEEVSSGAKPIEAVGTAVAAFVGLAP